MILPQERASNIRLAYISYALRQSEDLDTHVYSVAT